MVYIPRNTQFWWRVVAIDNCGNESVSCPVTSFFGSEFISSQQSYRLKMNGNHSVGSSINLSLYQGYASGLEYVLKVFNDDNVLVQTTIEPILSASFIINSSTIPLNGRCQIYVKPANATYPTSNRIDFFNRPIIVCE